MKLRTLLSISSLAMLLSGCDLFPSAPTDKYGIPTSNHTVQELCDSTKQFFAAWAGVDNLKLSPGRSGSALTDKIGTGNGCFYDTADGSGWPSHPGYVSLFCVISGNTLSAIPLPTDDYPVKELTVDGVTVKAATEPPLNDGDPARTLLDVILTATIDGWDGKLHFRAAENQTTRDDLTIRAGGQALVDMIRMLKD
ncbi:hypothetical protein DMB37_22360 [Nocardia sp. CS682]|nr:hypothetical protein DMB37_22360 [Nocardia sp. CS682]